jgi:tRNA-binding EMAP/Myf-like protein
VPTEIAPFLSKGKEPRVFNGVKGERLRTVKLRGVQSQGLLLKLTDVGEVQIIGGKKMIRLNKTYDQIARSPDGHLPNTQQDNQ